MMMHPATVAWLVLLLTPSLAFQSLYSDDRALKFSRIDQRRCTTKFYSKDRDDDSSAGDSFSRRDVLATGVAALGLTASQSASAAETSLPGFKPAKRPTAYRVDSTIPPTLLPLNAHKESQILGDLGRGSGTDKEAIIVDTLNLNNMLNKAVFGTANVLSNVVGGNKDESRVGAGYASFVCLGVPSETAEPDIDLATQLLQSIIQSRNSKRSGTALGLACCPSSTQSALDQYVKGEGKDDDLVSALTQAGVSERTIELYLPLFQFAKKESLDLLALAPEVEDVQAARKQGLQNLDQERRGQYVIDVEGFITLTQDPKFKLYVDRSLFKDYEPINNKDSGGNFFAERILVHETAATAAAQYAAKRPESLVTMVAPIQDVRFLQGINGRIPRICQYLNKDSNKVTNNAVTTILVNPTAKETLSKTRYLRLEIGTAPDTLEYQTKVADYLWFSSTPKVNLLPRLMDG